MIKRIYFQPLTFLPFSVLTKSLRLTLLILLAFSAQGQASNHKDAYSLEPIASDHFDSVHVANNAALPRAPHVYIAEIDVNFSPNWLSEFQSATTKHYRQRIKQEYAKMLNDHLEVALSNDGWTLIDQPNSDALTLIAKLNDLHINGPSQLNKQHILVHSVGQTSVTMEVKGTDGKAIFAIEDSRNAGGLTPSIFETDRATNYALFSRLTKGWADIFVSYLNLSTQEIKRS